jgi:predicted amidophosphoribosyltransferase
VWFRAALDVLFPAQCAACERIGAGVCDACVPVDVAPLDISTYAATPAIALGTYEGALRRAVLALKDGRRDVAEALGARLARLLETGCALVPVPTTKARLRVRGIDGVACIATVAASLREGSVHRVLAQRAGDAQRGRNRTERLAARGRFMSEQSVDRPVVLVDDVCTTGATLRDCCDALKSSGTRVSGAVVVAAAKSGAPCTTAPER